MENNDLSNLSTTEQLQLVRAHKAAIVEDLDVNQVIPYLLENLVLSHDDKQRIEHEITLKDKSEKLLNILEATALAQTELDVIPIFVESLRRDYDWLYKSLTETDVPDSRVNACNAHSDEDDNVFESPKHHKVKTMLEAGGVNCPIVAVERKQLVDSVRNELRHLKRNHFLVIQGMAGSGKSILAQQALNSATLITNVFPDGVFFLSVGKECSESKDTIMSKVRILCEKLEETRAPSSLEHGAEMLRAAFLKRPKALLVLDGVWRSEVIRSFDVGCATMITTRDISVIDVVHGRVAQIKMPDGFDVAESLELFRRSLNFEHVDHLPSAAAAIHRTCKGSPMVVSLISSLFQDHPDEVCDEGRWTYYLESLSKRRYSRMRRQRGYEHASIYDAVALSVNSLEEKKRSYYYQFALFQDDVPVPCPVLEVLWSLERYEVEDLMKYLVKKSLIYEEVHPSRNWHVYSIHSLQLDYLKYQLQLEESVENIGPNEIKLHDKLVSQYLIKCESQYEKLPDDDYIHTYLGYHLYKARRFSLFPDIYLNLLFIGEKLRLCGPADLLTDLRKYEEFIIGDTEEMNQLFEEICGFTEQCGFIKYGQEDVDIVQLALQNPNFDLLQGKARNLALSEPSRLYFEWIGADTKQWKNPESTIVCSDGVRCVKFVGDSGNHFLAGLNDGTIELCDMSSCGVIWIFSGHIDTVHCMSVCEFSEQDNGDSNESKLVFISASEDKTCKIWKTLGRIIQVEGNNSSRCRRSNSGSNSPSPKIRNSKWKFEKVEDQSSFTFEFHTAPVKSAEFSPFGKKVVSASANEILVWNTDDGQIIFKSSPPSSPFQSSPPLPTPPYLVCHFGPFQKSEWMPYLLFGTGNNLGLLSLHQIPACDFVVASNMNIVSVLFFALDWFCVVSENDIGLWKVEGGDSETVPRRRSLSPRRSFPLIPITGNGALGSTEADAIGMRNGASWKSATSQSGQFLLPPAKLEGFARSGGHSAPKHSPSNHSLSSPTFSAIVDTGEHFIRIFREHIIPKKTSTLFQCAAITQDQDGLLLACGTSNMKICLFNLLTKDFLGEFNTHTGLLRCLDFSRVDEWTLLSGSEDQTVMVWDVKDEIAGKRMSQKRPEYDSVFVESLPGRDSGHFLSMFSTDSANLQFYHNEAMIEETAEFRSEITVVCLSSCSSHIVVGTKSGAIYEFRPDWRRPVSNEGGFPNRRRKSIETPELIGDLENPVEILKFDPTSEYLVGVSICGEVLILKKFRQHHLFRLGMQRVVGIHFPFNKYVAFVCEQNQGRVVILDLDVRMELKGFDGSELGRPTSSSLKLDSSGLAIGTRKDGICLCSLRFGVGILRPTVIASKQKSAVCVLAFSPDSIKLAVGFKNGLIVIWSLSGSTYVEEQNLVLHKTSVRHLLFSPFEIGERRWLVSCGDRLAVWSLERPVEQIQKTSFMAERRRRKSGDSRPSSRLSLELPSGIKIGKQGKRELLNSFSFRGSYAKRVVSDPSFSQFVTVDNTGIFYLLRILTPENYG